MVQQKASVELNQGAKLSLRFLSAEEAESVLYALDELAHVGDPTGLPNVQRSDTGRGVYTMAVGSNRRLLFKVEPETPSIVVLGIFGEDQIEALSYRQSHTA